MDTPERPKTVRPHEEVPPQGPWRTRNPQPKTQNPQSTTHNLPTRNP